MSVTLKKIIHFVQYNNFFILFGIGVIMMGSAAFAASPELQQQVYSEKKITRSVDNTYIINNSFDTYDINLKVSNVSQDSDKFYVDYTYQTVEINDYVWKQVAKSSQLKVSKGELGSRDLGLYVAMQLGQLADEQKRYLQEVHGVEKKNGLTQKIVATEYTGLVGQFLSTDEKVFDGYVPVKQLGSIATQNTENEVVTPVIGVVNTIVYEAPLGLSKEQVEVMIQEAVNKIVKRGGTSTVVDNSVPVSGSAGLASSGNENNSIIPTGVVLGTSTQNETITMSGASTSPLDVSVVQPEVSTAPTEEITNEIAPLVSGPVTPPIETPSSVDFIPSTENQTPVISPETSIPPAN